MQEIPDNSFANFANLERSKEDWIKTIEKMQQEHPCDDPLMRIVFKRKLMMKAIENAETFARFEKEQLELAAREDRNAKRRKPFWSTLVLVKHPGYKILRFSLVRRKIPRSEY